MQLLLIENDPWIASLLCEAASMRASGLNIRHVDTFELGVEFLRSKPIDVVLVELNLPDEQGLRTLDRLRNEFPQLPVVVLTRIADEDMAITAIQSGAQDYLIKEAVSYGLVSRSVRYAYERKQIEMELERAKEEALAASRAKSEFLAHMSHEIRSPLTAILGFSDNLLEPKLAPDEVVAAAETIKRNSEHLLEIVNDILDISKIESCRFEIDQLNCSPAQIVLDVMEVLEPRARGKGLKLSLDWTPGVPATITSDPVRLKQILLNLVSNGVKFTTSGEVRIGVRLIERPAHEPLLQFSVSDTGIGMTIEQQHGLFKAYQQGGSWVSRTYGGTGLGLAISRELARKLGGDISLESELGQGSRFFACVATGSLEGVSRLNTIEESEAQNNVRTTLRMTNIRLACRVLLAEDGPDNRRLISYLLCKAGAQVTLAEDGQQAVDYALAADATEEPFDLVLMDMIMPGMDGIQATRRIREAGLRLPIIALTANAMSGVRSQCLAAGCDDFATKPIDRSTLLTVIRKWVKPTSTNLAALRIENNQSR
ncbi:Sensory/regulatory protein RpfC [Anatilimnocola aggregata]|uniref:histidine kinase n=1 Tax=Anatilimnocola aggregata TaxID=2528021 RepID=A0A517YLU5_9BACT|nr:hybrid sensor histidine kinase/response regulator [Anatilimnocola aggregata]QDU31202.1 Sensory/regulatory protein RpfC [Anatilimnocola aggregata]